jgi:hypothetical protein
MWMRKRLVEAIIHDQSQALNMCKEITSIKAHKSKR